MERHISSSDTTFFSDTAMLESNGARDKGHAPLFEVASSAVHQTLQKYMLADGFDIVFDLEKSQGSYMIDAATGKTFLDFFTCFASIPVGINHPKINDPAFVNYLGRVAVNKPSNSDLYSVEMATFVRTLFELAVPSHFRYSFFIEGGALAVENALKTAFDWKVRKNFRKGYSYERGYKILHFREAFHGRSGYTMSLTNTDPTKTKFFPKFDWPRVVNPAARFPLHGEHLEHTMRMEAESVAAIEQAFRDNPDEIAAIIIEPIQGEGGDNHFRPEFLRELRRLADEHEALLIFDEVQTGVGLTGSMWVHEQLGVAPDIMAFGKKMQVCGILVGPRVDEVEDNVFRVPSRINSTWGGNLVDMVRATRYLEIIHEERLVHNAATTGAYLLEQLRTLEQEFPSLISNARGRGLFCAFDLATEELRNSFRQSCYQDGLIVLGAGHRSMRFRPALTLSPAQVDEGLAIIRNNLKKISVQQHGV